MILPLKTIIRGIVTITTVSLFLIFSTSVYAGNSLAVGPSHPSQILKSKQSVAAVYPNREAGLRLALATDATFDDKDCERTDRQGQCRPLKKLEVDILHNLQFGKVVANGESGCTVSIDPANGNKTITGAYDGGGRHGPAEFEIKGEPEKEFVVTLPGGMALSGSNGGGPWVSEFIGFFPERRIRQEGGSSVIGNLGRDGKAVLLVGGTLKIPSHHGHKEMSGRSDIFVEYLF